MDTVDRHLQQAEQATTGDEVRRATRDLLDAVTAERLAAEYQRLAIAYRQSPKYPRGGGPPPEIHPA